MKMRETEFITKQLLETLFLAIKIYTDFTTDVIWMNTMCAVSLLNHLRAVADAFHRTWQKWVELHKSEVLLIASALLMVKAKNIYWNTIKMHKTMETELSHETDFRISIPHHKDMHWLHYRCYMDEHNVCIVTSKPSQSSSRWVLSFKDSSDSNIYISCLHHKLCASD